MARLNPRQEKFVREYVKTGNSRKSYEKAYGVKAAVNANAVDASASRTLSSAKVINAIQAHQKRIRTRHDYTVDTILEELDEARDIALATTQPSAAVQASTVKARMLGMIVDRKEIGAPGDFAGFDTVQAILSIVAKELGPDIAASLAKLTGDSPVIDVTPNESEKE